MGKDIKTAFIALFGLCNGIILIAWGLELIGLPLNSKETYFTSVLIFINVVLVLMLLTVYFIHRRSK